MSPTFPPKSLPHLNSARVRKSRTHALPDGQATFDFLCDLGRFRISPCEGNSRRSPFSRRCLLLRGAF